VTGGDVSIIVGRQLRQEMGPVALYDTAQLVIDKVDRIEPLYFLPQRFQLVRLEEPTPEKLHCHRLCSFSLRKNPCALPEVLIDFP
jgi:hypothetical protein